MYSCQKALGECLDGNILGIVSRFGADQLESVKRRSKKLFNNALKAI